MLETVEKENLTSYVVWQPHGRVFRIHNRKKFIETVLPRFFGKIKMRSFSRQINLYCFHRIDHGLDANGYYHEIFLRGKPFLIKGMVRFKTKENASRGLVSQSSIKPDFYSYENISCEISKSNIENKRYSASFKSGLYQTKHYQQQEPYDVKIQSDKEVKLCISENTTSNGNSKDMKIFIRKISSKSDLSKELFNKVYVYKSDFIGADIHESFVRSFSMNDSSSSMNFSQEKSKNTGDYNKIAPVCTSEFPKFKNELALYLQTKYMLI